MADTEACILHPTEPQLGDVINANMHTLVLKTSSTAVYRDLSGGQILLKGSGFEFEGDVAVRGTVTGAIFEDEKGATYLAWEV
ncbi:hypothetical protein IB238_04820 [Rhizobium sp. ARZ01]|uniref:hypothetical protein n=1 Tax=Rhizobium sp. ARZ01 TaxID=2769313 RepID=UPI0017811482|nr:hypothetical protein [Rhizobium sp. ARZ01]MBD9371958.1 hypothetical protein [Rhizobium sp. ARZ01]